MSRTLKEARERLVEIEEQNNSLLNAWKVESRSATEQEDSLYDNNELEINALKAEIKTLERIEAATNKVESRSVNVTDRFGSNIRTNTHKITKSDCDRAFRAWAMGGRADNQDVYSADKLNVDYKSQYFKLDLNDSPNVEQRAMSVGTNADGGYTVSTYPVQGIEKALKLYSNMRQECTVFTTAQGGNFPWATNNDTANSARIIGENTAVTETDLTVGQVVFGDYTYCSDVVKVSFQLLNDSSIPLADFIGEQLGKRLGRRQNLDMTTGDGSGKPKGFLVDATNVGFTATTSLKWQDLFALRGLLDPAYLPDSVYMMNNGTYHLLLQLASSQNVPLFVQGLDKDGYGTFGGHRIVINQNMPDWSAGNKAIAFGNFKKYIARQVGEILYKRLDERYADVGQVGFLAYHRLDAKLIDAGTHPIVCMVAGDGTGSGSGVELP